MKVLYLSPSGQLGGAEISLLNVLASIRSAHPHWPLRLIAAAEGPLISRARSLGVDTSVLSFPGSIARLGDAGAYLNFVPVLGRSILASRRLPSYLRLLRREIAASPTDVVHSNGFKMHILGAWARPREIPLIWHVHDYVRRRPIMRRLLRGAKGRCAAAIVNSTSVGNDLQSLCGDGLKIYRVYNAIDPDRFSPAGLKLDLDALSGLPQAAPCTLRVGIVSTLAYWKGHSVFLRALSRLPLDLPIRGYVIGGALYQTVGSQHTLKDLRGEAAQLGLAGKVGFTGFLEEPAAAMRALDIVVHASTEPEPFGLTIIEAMACGRAVIASEAGGAAEIFVSGHDALGHPPADAGVLAERIVQLAKDPELRTRLGKAGRAVVESRFDRARLASDLTPIYRQAISSATDARSPHLQR